MTRVLVLRPEPGATATLARARQLGMNAFAIPLFEVEAIEWQAPDARDFDALLLTSANAVRHGGPEVRRLRPLPVHAVGRATAEAAREAGFNVVSTGEGGVEDLLQSIDGDVRLLHVCGEDRTIQSDVTHPITAVPAYRAKEIAVDLSDVGDVVVLIHSPRAGARFAALVEPSARRHIRVAAISLAALVAAGDGWALAEAADKPTDEALLALAARLCNKTPAQ
jgi:uroporphyrinogen-III synthase